MKKYLSLLVMLTMSIAMSAEEISGSCGTDVTYTFDTETGVLTIEGTGAMSNYYNTSFNGVSVTSAPWGNYYQTITTVTISDGVTSIGDRAFYGCSSLTSIVIPDGVESIGQEAFYNCENLEYLEIGNTLSSVGSSAFHGCPNLSIVNIHSLDAWLKISGLENITNDWSRYENENVCLQLDGESLSVLEFEEGVTDIPEYAFTYFKNIIYVSLPNSLESISSGAFDNCMIEYISVQSFEKWFDIDGLSNLLYASCDRETNIGYTFCINGEPVSEFEIPEGMTEIPANAFVCMKNLSSVNIPNTVKSIGQNAFCWCENLTSIFIPSSVEKIEKDAFLYCNRLKTLEIGEDSQLRNISNAFATTRIAHYDFTNCPHLESFYGYYQYEPGRSVAYLQHNMYVESVKFARNSEQILDEVMVWNCFKLKELDLGINTGNWFGCILNCPELESVHTSFINPEFSNDVPLFVNCPKLKKIYINHECVDYLCQLNHFCHGIATEIVVEPGWYYPFKGNGSGELYVDDKPAKELEFSENVTEVLPYSLWGFSNIESITFHGPVSTIGEHAFDNCKSLSTIIFNEGKPANLDGEDVFSSSISIIVPDEEYNAYCKAWSKYKNQIVKRGDIMAVLELEAMPNASALDYAIGLKSKKNTMTKVIDLTISGTINSYDIMMIHNKMVNLHNLDLSNAEIVDCEKEYWDGCHTEKGILGSHAFSELDNLRTVKLPNVKVVNDAFQGCLNLSSVELPSGLEEITENAFQGCTNLSNIGLPNSLRIIGKRAFDGCAYIGDINIPEGVKEIGDSAFHASGVAELTLPESLKRIGDYAFANNTNGSLKNLQLPPYVEIIGKGAFENCSGLEVININPMVKSIGDKAFLNLTKLKEIYTYTLEPINIAQTTFDRSPKPILYVPSSSYEIYYNNERWNRFSSMEPSNEEYVFKSVYLNNDYVMTNETGIIGDTPDAELYENSALVNNASETQPMGELHVKYDGNTNSASVFGKITAEKVSVEIPVDGRKWYFFSFPFDIELDSISCSDSAQYVWRKYDGDLRAQTGTGWTNLTDATKQLCAGEGYIFQASDTCMLTLLVDAKTSFEGKSVEKQLAEHTSQNAGNAGWNYVGTPFLSYYDIDDLSYDSPITIWNAENQTYEAIRPGDDDVTLHPFQAFFVQATGEETLTFDKEKQETGNQAQTSTAAKARARKVAAKDDSRLLINLELTNGKSTDKTRVVFNEEKSLAYEANCDAAKFMATGVPQLYTICDQNKYAINERPYADGTVRLGFVAEKAGSFSIQATRMDTPCLLKDTKTGKVFDLTVGSYDFESEAGSFDNRFLLMGTAPTALDKFMAEGVSLQAQEGMLLVKGASQARIYNAAGALVAKGNGNHRLAKGTYIVEMGERSAKIVVK